MRDIPFGIRLLVSAIAVVIGVLVASLALLVVLDDDDDDSEGRGDSETLRRVLALFQGPGADIEVSLEGLPEDFPEALPRIDEGEFVAGVRALSPEGLAWFALYETTTNPSDVLERYEEEFRNDDWDIVSLFRTPENAGLQFDHNGSELQGSITIAAIDPRGRGEDDEGDEDQGTTYQLAISAFDADQGAEPEEEEDVPFDREAASLPLPPGFPTDRVPDYENATVIASAFLEQEGITLFDVQFVTEDDQEEVIEFYEEALPRGGWQVERRFDEASSIELPFRDAEIEELTGTVQTRVFLREVGLTEVHVQFSVPSD